MNPARTLGSAILLTVSLTAYGTPASLLGYPRDDELKLLPSFCTAKLKHKYNDPEYQAVLSVHGPDFEHSHHYCAGINFLRRYYQAQNPPDRRFMLVEATNNLTYMVTHAKPDYLLMPDVYLNRGKAYALGKHTAEAMADFLKAIELNPKLGKAYLELSDLYKEIKQSDKALAVLTDGLRHLPQSKALKRRYDELGGKKPYPEPYAPPEEKKEVVEAPPQKPDDALTPAAVRAKREGEQPAPARDEGATSATAATPENSATPAPAASGSARNPWCRFCAEDGAAPPNPQPPSTPAAQPTTAP